MKFACFIFIFWIPFIQSTNHIDCINCGNCINCVEWWTLECRRLELVNKLQINQYKQDKQRIHNLQNQIQYLQYENNKYLNQLTLSAYALSASDRRILSLEKVVNKQKDIIKERLRSHSI